MCSTECVCTSHKCCSVRWRQHKGSFACQSEYHHSYCQSKEWMKKKSSEERPAGRLVKWEVVYVLLMGSAAPGYHRPQTESPAETNIFTQGRDTTVSLKKQKERVDGGLMWGCLNFAVYIYSIYMCVYVCEPHWQTWMSVKWYFRLLSYFNGFLLKLFSTLSNSW